MPISNLGTLHLTAAQKTSIDNALNDIETILTTVAPNFSKEERVKYGSVNEERKLFVNKIRDYRQTSPNLSSPDVNWVAYEDDFQDRAFADTREQRIAVVLRMLTDFKIAHDYDNFQAGLDDYKYSQYKETTGAVGFTEKVADLKQFFPNTGGGATPPTV